MVVVDRERPAELLCRLRRLRADPDRPVRRLPGTCDSAGAAGRDDAFTEPSRCVPGDPRGELERVWAARPDVDFDHVPSLMARVGHAGKSVLRASQALPT